MHAWALIISFLVHCWKRGELSWFFSPAFFLKENAHTHTSSCNLSGSRCKVHNPGRQACKNCDNLKKMCFEKKKYQTSSRAYFLASRSHQATRSHSDWSNSTQARVQSDWPTSHHIVCTWVKTVICAHPNWSRGNFESCVRTPTMRSFLWNFLALRDAHLRVIWNLLLQAKCTQKTAPDNVKAKIK